jgi:hypothetical protein
MGDPTSRDQMWARARLAALIQRLLRLIARGVKL